MENKVQEEALNKLREFAERCGLLKSIRGTTLKILKMSKSQRKNFFDGIYCSKSEFTLPSDIELFLGKENILSYTNKSETKVTFTLKGLMMLEYNLDFSDFSTLRMLDDLNKAYFTKVFGEAEYPLSGEEKAIIITFLGLMSFSSGTSLKLSSYNDLHSNIEDFRSCVKMSIEFLRLMGLEYVDNTLDKIWSSNVRGEDPVNAKMARLNEISLKTNGTYHKGQRKEGHFLDVIKDGRIDSEKLEFLLRKLFDKGSLTFDQREKFIDLLKQIFSERHNFITNGSEFELLTNFYTMSEIVRTFT